jgi:hypothetical protein
VVTDRRTSGRFSVVLLALTGTAAAPDDGIKGGGMSSVQQMRKERRRSFGAAVARLCRDIRIDLRAEP